MCDSPLSKWRRPICWIKGHTIYNCNPEDYIGFGTREHDGEVPIGGCERCGKSWWMSEEKL